MSGPQDEIDALTKQVASLTARVYQLEQIRGISPQSHQEPVPELQPQPPASPPSGTMLRPPSAQTGSGPLPPPTPSPQPPTQSRPILRSPFSRDEAGLEKQIGQFWLNRIGIVALLFGVSYFLKYAFENNWIGPAGRVAIGLLAGIGLIVWSERFRNRGHAAFSYSLKAAGIGTLYLSLWGAFQIYHLIPAAAAVAAMVIVTLATISLAVSQDAELLASFALAGGF